jgi:hypothetical protein
VVELGGDGLDHLPLQRQGLRQAVALALVLLAQPEPGLAEQAGVRRQHRPVQQRLHLLRRAGAQQVVQGLQRGHVDDLHLR